MKEHKRVELIETYLKIGNDYQWFDNHGELIRCRNCKYWVKELVDGMCSHPKTTDGDLLCLECDANFYCGYAEKK